MELLPTPAVMRSTPPDVELPAVSEFGPDELLPALAFESYTASPASVVVEPPPLLLSDAEADADADALREADVDGESPPDPVPVPSPPSVSPSPK